jgi:hypothetical protein
MFYLDLRVCGSKLSELLSQHLLIGFRWEQQYSFASDRHDRLGDVQDHEVGTVVACQGAGQLEGEVGALREIGRVQNGSKVEHDTYLLGPVKLGSIALLSEPGRLNGKAYAGMNNRLGDSRNSHRKP